MTQTVLTFAMGMQSSSSRRRLMKVRGHCLVWDHNHPRWLANGRFTPIQLSRILHERIATVT
jgi:GH35 family endo-1,4-beta-xylanase